MANTVENCFKVLFRYAASAGCNFILMTQLIRDYGIKCDYIGGRIFRDCELILDIIMFLSVASENGVSIDSYHMQMESVPSPFPLIGNS